MMSGRFRSWSSVPKHELPPEKQSDFVPLVAQARLEFRFDATLPRRFSGLPPIAACRVVSVSLPPVAQASLPVIQPTADR